jgi:kynurenine formamidase
MTGITANAPAVTDLPFKQLGRRLSNWGRWGDQDELGTLNFITPSVLVEAARLVKTGRIFDLGMPLDEHGPQPGGGRFNPIHKMTRLLTDLELPAGFIVADDIVIMPLQCATQWDSLAHVGYDGLTYNGVPASAVTATNGASRNSIDKTVAKLVGRGVLLDIPGLKGVERLGPSTEIKASDLDAAAERQGVDVRSGDIVFVRTGWYQHFLEGDSLTYMSQKTPGLGVSCCEWLHDHEVAAVAADNYAVEVKPSTEAPATHPVHMILIRDLGMTLGEMFNLEELAADCRADGVWEFFFAGPGLKISHAVGSPLTPLAIK